MLRLCLITALFLGGEDVNKVEQKMKALIAHGDKLAKAGRLDEAIACYRSAVSVYERFVGRKAPARPRPVRASRFDPPADLPHLKTTDAATRRRIDALVKTMMDPMAGRDSLVARDRLVAIGKPAFPRILGAIARVRDTITDVDSHEERLIESSLKLADQALREMDGFLTAKNKATLRPGSEKRYIAYIARLHYKRWLATLKGLEKMPGPFEGAK